MVRAGLAAARRPCRARSRCSRSRWGSTSRRSVRLPRCTRASYWMLRPDRVGTQVRSGIDGHTRVATAPTGSDRDENGGSRTDRSPTSRSCGRAADERIRGFCREGDSGVHRAGHPLASSSLRASVTSEPVLEDVRCPTGTSSPGRPRCAAGLSCLDEARHGIVWGAVGAARACSRPALDYAQGRLVFGKPIAAYQLTQEARPSMALEINRGSLVALHLGRMKTRARCGPST